MKKLLMISVLTSLLATSTAFAFELPSTNQQARGTEGPDTRYSATQQVRGTEGPDVR